MTINDPDTFLTEVNTKIDDVTDAIGDFLEKMAGFVNDHLTEMGGIGGFILGGPIGGLIGGYTAHQLEGKFNHACDQVSEAWEQGVLEIRKSIGNMVGDPLMMSQIASNYRDAASIMGKHKLDLGNANSVLGSDWSGRAFDAYTTVSGQQDNALSGLSQQLQAAGKLLDTAANNLIQQWIKQLDNLAQCVAAFLNVSGDLGDLGNAPTFEAGPALKLIGEIVSHASTILTDYASYVAELEIVGAGDWDGLNTNFGDRGLPDGQWPRIGDIPRGAMNDPWEAA
jgi:uncharacterized protein YukE